MILFFIVPFVVYAALHARTTVKHMNLNKNTPEAANATTRLLIMVVGALLLLAAMAGGL